ncbi:MAG TPA: hemolysin family protein [Ignavibacteriaceae bacterium]|nr:hemolysin family protein [Ignavibacteriaceae bacterium]
MDIDWHLKIVIILILFCLYIFFSGSEAAFVSIKTRKNAGQNTGNDGDNEKNNSKQRYLNYFLEKPRQFLTAVFIVKTFIKAALIITAASSAVHYSAASGISIELSLIILIIAAAIIFIYLGEFLPKAWVVKRTGFFSGFAVYPLYWVNIFIHPVSETFAEISRIFLRDNKKAKGNSVQSAADKSGKVNPDQKKSGTQEEQELIRGITDLRSVDVRVIMTPRVDINAISADADFNELLEIITSSGYSRLPLFKDDLDNILGIINTKDILQYLKSEEQRKQLSLTKIARKAMFIPGSKKIDDLLREFQGKKMHIAIVVDEFGGTAGLITLEDILEEIIGEIRDEYDEEENPVAKINDRTFLVLGKISIDELNELLNLNIRPNNGDFETVAGLILNYAGQIPKDGYSFSLENYKFTVKEVLNKRIKKVLIEKIEGE